MDCAPIAVVLVATTAALSCRPAAAEVQRRPDSFVVKGDGHAVALSATDGSILSVQQPGKPGSIWRSGEHGLWHARFRDGSEIGAAAFGAGERTFRAQPDGNGLRLEYRGPEIEVVVAATTLAQGVEFAAQGTPKGKALLEFALPARLRFAPEETQRFVSPANGNASVGTAFRGAFFALQPQDRPTGWERSKAAGPKGYVALYGGPLDQRADQDPPTALTVTADGTQWLGASLAKRVTGQQAVVNRPPTRAQADLVLADSANGPYFSAKRLGTGSLWRLGGAVGDDEQQNAADMVFAVLRRLVESAPAGRRKLGLVALRNGPSAGGWAGVEVQEWLQGMRQCANAANGQVEFVELSTPGEMLGALAAPDFLAVLNPYGEWAPVPDNGGMDATVAAVGDYVRAGGNWFEVGGYPFFYELRPVRYFRYGTDYPAAFADFFHLDTSAGSASVYRVQPQKWQPWEGAKNPEAIFVPGRLGCGGDEQGGYCDRPFCTYVMPGETWHAPAVRLTVGRSAGESLVAYAEANEIKRRLEEKMPPEVLRKFKESVLVYYGGNCREKLTGLDKLPVPTQVHFADYLKGGFDKQYPDHLPPHPNFGTPEEFRALFDRCHQLGHLVMPYTNPTWWCDHPKGPTFEREGEAPLLKRLDGKPTYERYAANDGWTVCHWHPAVQAANRHTVRQFTDEYPVDILFQDQCGARGWQYDTNPASPTPYAYSDGLISMVAEDCRTKPLSTESGWDRVVNYESQLCGMSWQIVPTEGGPSWRRLMKEEIPPDLWTVFPLAQYLAHDKCAMLYHDLGQFVTTREVLAWTLGLGFSMSYRVGASALEKDAPREWLRWLDRLQKSVCAQYVGEPVRAFAQVRPSVVAAGAEPVDPRAGARGYEGDGVLRATFGPVAVVSNLDPAPVTEGPHKLPPFGFHASAPGVVAANLANVGGRDFGDEGVSFVTQGDARKAEVWVYAPAGDEAAVELPAAVSGPFTVAFDDGPKVKTAAEKGVLTLRLPSRPGVPRLEPPAALAGKAPSDWPGARPKIGVLDFGPGMAPTWTTIQPADWLKAFAGSRLATELGVSAVAIANYADLAAALRAGPTAWLAILNPYGENFPAAAPGKWRETLEAVRGYVENGGSWWETAGYSLYSAVSRVDGRWQGEPIGSSGMSFFGLPVGGGEVDQPAEPLLVTPVGQAVLGAELSAKVAASMSPVNRGLSRGVDDPGHVTLVTGQKQDLVGARHFIGAYRLNGWGWLWRIGGFNPNPEVAVPVAVAAMEYVYTHPPLPVKAGGVKYLWHAVVETG